MTITKAQIVETFAPIIENVYGFIPPSDFGNYDAIILFEHGGSKGTVPVDRFYEMFKGATDMTAASFHAVDKGILGYDEYITYWGQTGLFEGNYQPFPPTEEIPTESPAE
jgi:hypothetical protein